MNPKINSTNYEWECFEFGDGYHRNCRNDVRGSGAVMHLNAHKILFCLHMSEKSSTFARKMCVQTHLGVLAHLARAQHWQCWGERFESAILHKIKSNMTRYSFSGHESFYCKSLWLKKGYDFLTEGQRWYENTTIGNIIYRENESYFWQYDSDL